MKKSQSEIETFFQELLTLIDNNVKVQKACEAVMGCYEQMIMEQFTAFAKSAYEKVSEVISDGTIDKLSEKINEL